MHWVRTPGGQVSFDGPKENPSVTRNVLCRTVPRLKFGVHCLLMQGITGERWRELCKEIAEEKDPNKFVELVRELNRLLDEKEQRLGITTRH